MRRARTCHVTAAALAGCLLPVGSAAAPQANLGLTVGGVARETSGAGASDDVHVGARGDVLFLRSAGSDMGLGPYVDVASAGLTDVDLGGGLEWLLPVTTDFPLLLAAGGFAREGAGRSWAPGAEGTLLFGPRSYNFHSWYSLGGGVFLQTRWVPEAPGSWDFVAGIDVDLELLVLPAVLLYEAVAP